MILRPEPQTQAAGGSFVSAWEAIAETQKKSSGQYHLVRQPDHARLSGQIVERFAIAGAFAADDGIIRGVSLHDQGWENYDNGREPLRATPATYDGGVPLNPQGKPLSFLEIKARDFLRAWALSIEGAEAVAPIAGLIVSGHFRRIGRFGLSIGAYSAADAQRVGEFVASEELRGRRLLAQQTRSEREVEYWTDVLQFCDLLSLYLCCGSADAVEFPQCILPSGKRIRMQSQDGVFVMSPALFADEVEFSLNARPYPAERGTLSSRMAWRVRGCERLPVPGGIEASDSPAH